jgi:hypothetical protein
MIINRQKTDVKETGQVFTQTATDTYNYLMNTDEAHQKKIAR